MPVSAIIVLVITVGVLLGGLSYCIGKAMLHKGDMDTQDTN